MMNFGNLNESNILSLCDNDFSSSIKEKGKEYYYNGYVLKCSKTKEGYIARVKGSSSIPYKVFITIKDGKFIYRCDCPCSYPCKHEYAVLLAIKKPRI